jgi:hypothetical protein
VSRKIGAGALAVLIEEAKRKIFLVVDNLRV